MEEEELLSPDEIRKIENELELKLANMTLEDLEESSGPVSDFFQIYLHIDNSGEKGTAYNNFAVCTMVFNTRVHLIAKGNVLLRHSKVDSF